MNFNYCDVCYEIYKKIKNKKLTCEICNFDVCRKCQENYIKSKSNILPHCMKCKSEFSNEFIEKNFTNNFIKSEVNKNKENILFNLEKSLLPITQEKYLDIYKQIKLIKNKKLLKREFKNFILNINDNENFIIKNKCKNNNCIGYLSYDWKCKICNKYTCKNC